jgi:uncharacterized membrane protein YkvA (DUF1232 family)
MGTSLFCGRIPAKARFHNYPQGRLFIFRLFSSGSGHPILPFMQTDTEIRSSRVLLPAVIARNEKIVREGFWKKLLKKAGRVPFAEELATAYYCVADPTTPPRVRGILLAALAYFVVPVDAIPDFLAGIGFTDDATVVAGAIALVARYIRPEHRDRARAALHLPPREG